LHRGGDRGDSLGDGHVVVGWDDPQGFHVVPEQLGLFGGKVLPVHSGGGGAFQQRVVDIRHVLHVVDGEARVQPQPHQDVVGEVGGRVAEVGGVVGGDAAYIE